MNIGPIGSTEKKVGLYLRVSTAEQSTELQRQELTAYCQKRGWTIAKIYEDKASGTSRANRKMLDELMSDCRRRHIDLVLVWKLDRWFRSLKDMISTLDQLSSWNVEFVSLTDNVNLESAQGRLLFHLISAFGEFEASLIRSRIVAGLRASVANGTKLGRPSKVNEELVSEIIKLRKLNLSIRQIARRLGISKTSVLRVVQNPGNTEQGRI